MKFNKLLLSFSIGLSLTCISSLAFAKYTIGFSQIGEESEWRLAHTKDIKEAAIDHNVNLIFSDGQEIQENQIKAIQSFIQQKVDLIGFVPIVESGWDNVLQEAKKANIPVLIVDRDLQTKDTSLFVAKIGTNSYKEGKIAFEWIDSYFFKNNIKPKNNNDVFNIVIIEGTKGSSAAFGRDQGFKEAFKLSVNKNKFKILDSKSGDFKKEKGQKVMESFLDIYKNDIDILFAHNDDMALGAIKAIEDYGLKPGKDIIIVSCDAVKSIFDAMLSHKTNATVECNPLQGDLFFDTATKILKGERVSKGVFIEDGIFDINSISKDEILNRKY